MLVEKSTINNTLEVLQELKTKLVLEGEKAERIIKMIDSASYIFSNQVIPQTIRIESTYEELGSLVDDYLKMLSTQQNLAVLVTIGLKCRVEAYKRIQRMMKNCDSSVVVPDYNCESNIKLFVSFYKALDGERFDLNFFSKYCS